MFWLVGRHNECGLLALHQANMCIWAVRKQMLPEEALVQLPVGWQQTYFHQRYVSPSLKSVAVAVYAVLYDVTAMHLPQLVYLPEDDVSATSGTDKVVLINLLELLLSEV